MLCAPDRLKAGLDGMIERERDSARGDPDQEAKAWSEQVAEADRLRSGYQELAAKGLMTHEELGEKLAQVGESRKVAEHELRVIRERREHVEELERDRDALLTSYAGTVPEALDGLAPEERRRVFSMLRLKVVAGADGSREVTGVLGVDLGVCVSGSTSTSLGSCTPPTPPSR